MMLGTQIGAGVTLGKRSRGQCNRGRPGSKGQFSFVKCTENMDSSRGWQQNSISLSRYYIDLGELPGSDARLK